MKADTLRRQLALQDALLTKRAATEFGAFVVQAWPVLEPSTRFLANWHIELVGAHLMAVTAGETSRLVINLPPRYMKSLLVSVFWPCWEWIQAPETRWLFASYSESLSTKLSLDRRTLLQSPWYQARFGDRVQLTVDQNEKTEYRNRRGGVMVATSVGGTATGKGGNRIVVDDPHNPLQAESDRQRQEGIDFFFGTLSTRLDDKRRGAIVVVGHRLHHRDLSAVCLERHYTHLCLPAEAETAETIRFPRSRRVHRREVGALLWPEREGAAELAAQKVALGAHAYAGQYQQRPSPREGHLFQRAWWRYYDALPRLDRVAQSWDLAFKDGEDHDFVVGLVAGQRGADIYLLDRVKAHLSFQRTCAAIHALVSRYPRTGAVYIEDKANGPAVIDALQHQVPGLIAVNPEGGKFSRAWACEPRVEAGNVYLPRSTQPNGTPMPERAWVEDFIEQLAIFPKGEHDDDVDAFTQLLVQWASPAGPPYDVDALFSIGALRGSRWDDGDDDGGGSWLTRRL